MSLPARLRARLSAGQYLVVQLTAATAAIVGAALVVGYLAANIGAGEPLTLFDAQIAAWFHAHARQPFTETMLMVSMINGYVGIPLLTALFVIILAHRREWQWIAFVVFAVPGGMGVNVLAKLAFARQRPSFDDPIVVLLTYSFPSGHTVAATLFYGTLAAFLTPRVNESARPWLWIGAVAMVALVALSRVYLGAHYVSDVLAGFAEGVAWLSCCMVAWSTYLWELHRRALRTMPAFP